MRRRYKKYSLNKTLSRFKSHRHKFKIGRMRGLTSIPVRYRGYRI